MILAWFLFGTVGFWILASLWLLITFACIGFEKYGFATVITIAAGAAIFFANPGIGEAIAANPLLLIAGAVAYLLAGVAWSFAKWIMLVKDAYAALMKIKNECDPSNFNSVDLNGKPTVISFEKWFESCKHRYPEARRPVAKDNKSRITSWMAYWPLSLASFLIFDALRRLFRTIYERLLSWYEAITNRYYPQPK